MSIHEMLETLEEEGHLIVYPAPPGRPMRRRLYLAAGLYREMGDHRSGLKFFGQMPAVQAVFKRWVCGDSVSMRLNDNGHEALLARLKPPPEDIWELRVTEPKPQLRIFACFAATDILVGMSAVNRDRLGRAFARSGRQSKLWTEAMYGCQAEWRRLFGGAAAFRGRQARDYVSKDGFESGKPL